MQEGYPRPDFHRGKFLEWQSLNGPWTLLLDDKNEGLSRQWPRKGLPTQIGSQISRTIQVPYAFQTPASGIGLREAHEFIWYERHITDIRNPVSPIEKALILRFGAVDYECTVWVDGDYVGSHRGGHTSFDLDLSGVIKLGRRDPFRLTIRVRDSPTDLTQPRGKQYWGPVSEDIYYTPTSGIWQSVWLESVPVLRIGDGSVGTILRSDDIDNGTLHSTIAVTGRVDPSEDYTIEVIARLDDVLVKTTKASIRKDKHYANVEVDMRISRKEKLAQSKMSMDDDCWQNGVALWTPEHPILYDLIIRLYDGSKNLLDEIHTTTGMRKISWQDNDGTFRLNGNPYFQALVLDQGYWPETGLTPPSQEALKLDIELAKRMGFNGCRKHQKVEDPVFLHFADRLGFLVWGEMASAYEYDEEYAERFNEEWVAAVKRDINHPSIVVWTIANESWGYPSLKNSVRQRDHIRVLYYLTKCLDPTRPINDNCGWEHVIPDLITYHDYADSAELATTCAVMEGGILGPKANHVMMCQPIQEGNHVVDPGAQPVKGAPVICTEFGGVNIAPPQGETTDPRDWGYTTASDAADLLLRIERLVSAVVTGGHTCGLVWTQLTDVEQEINGLYNFDRQEKVPAAEVAKIMRKYQDLYYESVAPK